MMSQTAEGTGRGAGRGQLWRWAVIKGGRGTVTLPSPAVHKAMRVKVRWVAALLVGIWVVMTVLYLAPLFWTAGQDERVVRIMCYLSVTV